jgi:hypothetical protein
MVNLSYKSSRQNQYREYIKQRNKPKEINQSRLNQYGEYINQQNKINMVNRLKSVLALNKSTKQANQKVVRGSTSYFLCSHIFCRLAGTCHFSSTTICFKFLIRSQASRETNGRFQVSFLSERTSEGSELKNCKSLLRGWESY